LAVACCSRSDSDFSRAASGVDCGVALLSGLSEREQALMLTKRPAERIRTIDRFIELNPTRISDECNDDSVRCRFSLATCR
jgi:hypothetical protein